MTAPPREGAAERPSSAVSRLHAARRLGHPAASDAERVRLLRVLPTPLRSRIAVAWERALDDAVALRLSAETGARRCRDTGVPPEQMLLLLKLLLPEPDARAEDAVELRLLRRRILLFAIERYYAPE